MKNLDPEKMFNIAVDLGHKMIEKGYLQLSLKNAMSKKNDFNDPEKLAKAREHLMKVYAASAEKARTQGGGPTVISDDDIERVANDVHIQELLDDREAKTKEIDFKTAIRQGRLKSARTKGTHTQEQWLTLVKEFDYRCLRCGCQPIGGPTKDHIIPLSYGGSDSIDNLQPLCQRCNSSGGAQGHSFNWIEWRRSNGFGLGTGCFCWMKQK